MLSTPWEQRKSSYDIVIIGSGYGGAIAAARLAGASLNPKRTICILERGKEWKPGDYPEDLPGVLSATRGDPNLLGLYELLNYTEISVIKGSGLGGTSLINANVAIGRNPTFSPNTTGRAIHYDDLQPYYQRARQVLASTPHPRAMQLAKIKALSRRADGARYQKWKLSTSTSISRSMAQILTACSRTTCIDCGNCVSGCNIGAKNTLYMNYLPMAVAAGVTVHSQTTHKLHVLTQFDIHDSHSRRATSSGAVFGGYRAKIL